MVLPLDVFFFLVLATGWAFSRLTERLRLPGILGMTLAGLSLNALARRFAIAFPPSLPELEPFLKSLALIVILLRAGLGLSRRELNHAGLAAVLMAFLPSVVEAAVIVLFLCLGLGWDLFQASLAAFIVASVSPAVVIPAMLELKAQGRGRGVVTTLLAGASADNVFAVTIFTALLALGRGEDWVFTAVEFPLSLVGGLVLGILGGWALSVWFHRHHERIRATEKSLILVLLAMALVRVGNLLHLAALLGVMSNGLILLERAPKAAHEIASKLGKVWVVAQIVLFVFIGLDLTPEALLSAVGPFLALLVFGLAARSLGVWLALLPSRFSPREKFFCVAAYWPKATVQAALGGIPLSLGLSRGGEILSLAVLSIVVTAPLGLIAIRTWARKLLPDENPTE